MVENAFEMHIHGTPSAAYGRGSAGALRWPRWPRWAPFGWEGKVLAVPTDVTREVALLEVFDVVGEVGALGDEVLGGKGERDVTGVLSCNSRPTAMRAAEW